MAEDKSRIKRGIYSIVHKGRGRLKISASLDECCVLYFFFFFFFIRVFGGVHSSRKC